LIGGTLLVLVGWIVIAALVGWLASGWWGLLLLVASPPLGYVALRWGEGWHTLREGIAAGWLRLHRRDLVEGLIARRRTLAEQVRAEF
jgi:hypothetical protein